MSPLLTRLRSRSRRDGAVLPGTNAPRGQTLVELALILPVLLIIVMGTLEFGLVFDHHLTLEYATREGARAGAALANGGGPLGCNTGQSPNRDTVDPRIVAAAERVLAARGSPIRLDHVSEIRIYKATSSGNETPGAVDVYVYAPGAGPTVDGKVLDFKAGSTQTWPACSRNNATNPESIGVSVTYTYTLQTPLESLLSLLSIHMHDRTVMQLNPTNV
jgi:TadE-like protein